MAKTRTTVLMTDDRVSHALTVDNAYFKGTACGRTFASWAEGGGKYGPWPGVNRRRGMIDCMTCIVRTGTS